LNNEDDITTALARASVLQPRHLSYEIRRDRVAILFLAHA